jgi:hypothetical protein
VLTLLFVAAFALPPTDNLVHFSLTLEGFAGYHAWAYPGATTLPTGLVAPSSRTVYAGGELDGSIYLRPLRDDDAPAPYQAFLQRTPTLQLSVGGSGGTGSYVGPVQQPEVLTQRIHWSFASASISGYPLSWLRLATGLDLRDDFDAYDSNAVETLSLTPWASAGVRFGDALISVGYQAPLTNIHQQNDEDKTTSGFHLPFAGAVYFNGDFIIRRTAAIDLSLDLVEHGAHASGSLSVFFSRRFAFDVGLGGGSTRATGEADSLIDVDASIGLSWWVISRAGARIGYRPRWWGRGSESQQEHVVTLSLMTRPR